MKNGYTNKESNNLLSKHCADEKTADHRNLSVSEKTSNNPISKSNHEKPKRQAERADSKRDCLPFTDLRNERNLKYVTLPACISDIFLHDREYRKHLALEKFIKARHQKENECNEYISIYPNMTEIKAIHPIVLPSSNRRCGLKGNIKEFSKKSRLNFIKLLCKLVEPIELWQDFTFADDIMANKTIEGRKDVSNKALNRFRRIIKREHPALWAIYKREWQPRKSGILIGEHVPHFHMFIADRSISDKNDYLPRALELGNIWVSCTGTTEHEKALSVATNAKSYRLIENQRQAMIYAAKYVTKADEFKTEESIGRSWGTIGEIKKGKPQIIELTPEEAVILKRTFRKKVKNKKHLLKALRKSLIPTFVIIRDETVERILKYIGDTLEWECLSFFGEVS